MRELVSSSTVLNGESFLWRVAKPSVKDSYLLGTFHAGGNQILENWETFPLLFSDANALIAETDFQDAGAREFTSLSFDNVASLETKLDPEFFLRASQLLTPYGLPADAIQKMKPWRAFLQLAGVPREPASLDAILVNQARASGLPVLGLQTAGEMVASMEALSAVDQVQILKETVCNYEMVQEQSRRLERLYAQDAAKEFAQESARLTSPVAGLTEKLDVALVANRNQIFLPRLLPKFDVGAAVALVGAGHLFGADGMVELLRANGFTVTALERRAFASELLVSANKKSVQPVDDLLKWLRSTNLKIPQSYQAPRIEFAASDDVERPDCDDDCEMAIDGGKILISVGKYKAVQNGEPNTMADILAYLIRDIQMHQGEEPACTEWQRNNIQSVILRSQYLARRGTSSAGLKSLPLPSCH